MLYYIFVRLGGTKMLFRIFGLKETTSIAIVSVFGTIICIALIAAILLFIFIRKGMLKISFGKATKTILGRSLTLEDKQSSELKSNEVKVEELAPMKITVFDIKEEQKKFDTAQRESIKSSSTSKKAKKEEVK